MNTAPKLVMKCCICGREKNGREWSFRARSDPAPVRYTHGFCKACYETEIQKVKMSMLAAPVSLYQ